MKAKEAKANVEEAGLLQEQGVVMDCPRCGRPMRENLYHNALSRQADVYVCDICGMDEALTAATGRPPLPFEHWHINLAKTTGGVNNG